MTHLGLHEFNFIEILMVEHPLLVSERGSWRRDQHFLKSRAKLKLLTSLNPKPPISLVTPNLFHSSQCIFEESLLNPQLNFLKKELSLTKMDLGSRKILIVYVIIAWMTIFRSISFLPVDKTELFSLRFCFIFCPEVLGRS